MNELLRSLKALVAKEREINVEILRKLCEAEASRLYARMGYSSLHVFCVDELGYSDGAAARRIAAMRLIREEPAVEQKLASGELNLTTAADLGRTFREAEKQSVELPKAEIIAAACGKSSREAEKEIKRAAADAGLTVALPNPERQANLAKVLAHYSHSYPGLTPEALFDLLLAEKAEAIDANRPRRRSGVWVQELSATP